LPDPSLPRTRRFQKRRGEILEWLQGIEDEDDDIEEEEFWEIPVDEPYDIHWAEQQLRDYIRDIRRERELRDSSSSHRG
jgi:hypothetical protein